MWGYWHGLNSFDSAGGFDRLSFFLCTWAESMSVMLPASQLGSEVVYGVFTTGTNSLTGSAVCAFKMRDILDVFDGSFKAQEKEKMQWLPVPSVKVRLPPFGLYKFLIVLLSPNTTPPPPPAGYLGIQSLKVISRGLKATNSNQQMLIQE